jgi:DNA-binding PadR family transcriptional regulator
MYIRNGYIRNGDMVTTSGNAQDQLPLTPVVLHILLSLADERQGKHGYAVAREVEELTEGQIRMGPGTLYGSFQRMLDAGLIEERRARAGAEDDERRRYYRVTSFGRRVLGLELSRLASVVEIARRKQLLPA